MARVTKSELEMMGNRVAKGLGSREHHIQHGGQGGSYRLVLQDRQKTVRLGNTAAEAMRFLEGMEAALTL